MEISEFCGNIHAPWILSAFRVYICISWILSEFRPFCLSHFTHLVKVTGAITKMVSRVCSKIVLVV